MNSKDLTPEQIIQFARNLVMIAESFKKMMTMDQAVAWLTKHGEFDLKDEDSIVLSPESLATLNEYIQTLQ